MNNDTVWCPNFAVVPQTEVSTNDREVLRNYYRKYLIQRAISVYEWDMPAEWNREYFMYNLYVWGFVSVVYTWEYGWIPQRCSLRGYNLFDSPSGIGIYNQFLGTIERNIGEGCVLFHFNPDYSGISDIIDDYACQLAEMRLTGFANMYNSKVSYLFAVPDKKTGDIIGKVIDNVMQGKPASIVKQKEIAELDFFQQNVKQSYIVNDILVDVRKILNAFDTEVGIPNANTEKKERQITDEVNSNNCDTRSKAARWLENFKDTCEMLNRISGQQLMSVKWRKEVAGNESIQTSKPGADDANARRNV